MNGSAGAPGQATLAKIASISAAVKARMVWIVTLPAFAMVKARAIPVASSGASVTATTSYSPGREQ